MTDAPAGRSRSLVACLAIAIGIVVLGLLSRQFPAAQPVFVAAYAGDSLWAAAVYWMLATVFLRAAALTIAAMALGVAVLVETSQLYHAPWIDQIRSAGLGALVLGQGFLWSDLACYAVGVVLAAALDLWLARVTTRKAIWERTR